ncbi:MAG: hypothetical protein JSS02_13945 [Planctomycetes bacterium]|nr:hypothetical protein [Planctomycetota bacterium]
MLPRNEFSQRLPDLPVGQSGFPTTVTWNTDTGGKVEADLTANDTLSCAIQEIRATAPTVTSLEQLQTWAEHLCQKVTYLLERIAPLEADATGPVVLVRSTPPAPEPDRICYYEILLQTPCQLLLRRYAQPASHAHRAACDMHFTHEALAKLVGDILATLPTAVSA